MSDEEPSFPLANMPRMGRRNAIVAALNDSQPAVPATLLTSGNVLSRSSNTNIGQSRVQNINSSFPNSEGVATIPRPATTNEALLLGVNADSQPLTLLTPLKPNTASTVVSLTSFNASVISEWKKLQDTSPKLEGIHAILRDDPLPVETSDPVPTTSQKKPAPRSQSRPRTPRKEEMPSKERSSSVSPTSRPNKAIIPWRNPLPDDKAPTKAEERRKIFEAFDLTSAEPPETPKISESKIKKKKKKVESVPSSSESEESLVFPLGFKYKPDEPKPVKGPYSGVQAKVNTRWNKWEDLQNGKLNSLLSRTSTATNVVEKPAPPPAPTTSYPKPGPSRAFTPTKPRTNTHGAPPPARPITPKSQQQQADKMKKPGRIPNYPAADTVKDYPKTDNLPLTIGPRFTHRKAWKMITGPQKDTVQDAGTRLYGNLQASPLQKQKSDLYTPLHLQQREGIMGIGSRNNLKSTFYNLERINNGRMKMTNKSIAPNTVKKESSLLNFDLVTRKKSPMLVTTIQAPPSPFLASNISIPSQMNAIPINGEYVPHNLIKNRELNKKDMKAGFGRKGRETMPVRNEGKPQQQGSFISLSSSPARKGAKGVPSNTKPAMQVKSVFKGYTYPQTQFLNSPRPTIAAALSAHRNLQQQRSKQKLAPGKTKVVPMLGKSPNKYNNIYIGPYSGSESEGEGGNSSKNKK